MYRVTAIKFEPFPPFIGFGRYPSLLPPEDICPKTLPVCESMTIVIKKSIWSDIEPSTVGLHGTWDEMSNVEPIYHCVELRQAKNSDVDIPRGRFTRSVEKIPEESVYRSIDTPAPELIYARPLFDTILFPIVRRNRGEIGEDDFEYVLASNYMKGVLVWIMFDETCPCIRNTILYTPAIHHFLLRNTEKLKAAVWKRICCVDSLPR
jgi:hypothetical protein